MPELPDVVIYVEALSERIVGHTLVRAKLRGPFLLRTVEPPIDALYGHTVERVERAGKRIAIGFEHGLWLVIHLMIAGRLHWNGKRQPVAAFEFDNGTLTLTEAGTQHRAQIHVLDAMPETAGLEVFDATRAEFAAALRSENHTLKRALTDPRLFSGIGNAYSDEILHLAQLSPVSMTLKLSDEEVARLYGATREVLAVWTERLRAESGGKFPEKVTAFREEMAAHGKYGQPCPRCGGKIQRIRYAANETNYCPTCQTRGKLLADRALSRLLREDWPRTPEQLENFVAKRRM
ncbi:MAG: DNA-(apurinic or apyrimidinic site) lyase / Formamidopyrimidine-DNA glycosylase [Candidatus Solibacter sp.]|jgi:formamidopyrimidine-DNA glycosylase|nr:DNA-(apurinic or apyrimidinic site) lyase / Formamidopyrimidine-DNA glycosylase [Candidatus Solibacter sp.]